MLALGDAGVKCLLVTVCIGGSHASSSFCLAVPVHRRVAVGRLAVVARRTCRTAVLRVAVNWATGQLLGLFRLKSSIGDVLNDDLAVRRRTPHGGAALEEADRQAEPLGLRVNRPASPGRREHSAEFVVGLSADRGLSDRVLPGPGRRAPGRAAVAERS